MRLANEEKYQRDVPCDTCDGIGWVLSREIKVDGKPATLQCRDCLEARKQAAVMAMHEEKHEWVDRYTVARDNADRLNLTEVHRVLWAHDRDCDGDYDCDTCTHICDEVSEWVEWPCSVAVALIEAMETITRMETA